MGSRSFYWRKYLDQANLVDTLNTCVKCTEKSLGDFEKNFQLTVKNAKETQNVVQKFWQNLIFLVETFFQRCLQNFLSVWRMCSRYLQGPPDLHLCVSKKSGTARHTNNKISTKKGAVKNFHKVHALRNFYQFWANINCPEQQNAAPKDQYVE